MNNSLNGANNSDIIVQISKVIQQPLKPDTKAAWKFLNWIVPGGSFSVRFENQNGQENWLYKRFHSDEFADFDSYLRELNSNSSRYNVFFDPNSAGYCGQTERDDNNCFDYIALRLQHTSQDLGFSEVQQEILEDMVDPKRRPYGLPFPTALWNTNDGCAALWRMNRPMGLSQGLDVGDIVACALENDDFAAFNEKYLQLPYTVCWPSAELQSLGRSPALIKLPKPFNIQSRPAEHDWYAFRWLVDNSDMTLAEYDY